MLGGTSAALVSFCVPPILARSLPNNEYEIWNLALPIVSYVVLFGTGIHLATAKFISQADGASTAEDRARTVRAALTLALFGAGLAFSAVFAISNFYPRLYPGLSGEMLASLRTNLMWIGSAAAFQILALVPLGIFTGHQQNACYVSAQVFSRVLTLALIWGLASLGAGVSALAIAYSISTALVVPAAFGMLWRVHPQLVRAFALPADFARLRRMLAYCGSFSLWTLAELFVSSLDLALVGLFALASVNPYAIALSLIGVFNGLLHALVSPMLPGVSALANSEEGRKHLPALLRKASLWTGLATQSALIGFLAIGHGFISLYTPRYADSAFPILAVLLVASNLRLISLPYSIFLLSTALHSKAIPAILAEALTNLAASVLLGMKYGALGVALGTLAGAVVSALTFCLIAFPSTPHLVPSTRSLLWNAVLKPFLLLSPLHLACLVWLPPFPFLRIP